MTSLVKIPAKSLRKPSVPLDLPLDDGTKDKLAELAGLCVKYRGVGLAAPQVGWNVRAFAIMAWEKSEDGKNFKGEVLINPEIVWTSEETHEVEEGCLSIPHSIFRLSRPTKIKIKAVTLDGDEVERELSGLSAQCIQHEMDHLDGVLISDRTK